MSKDYRDITKRVSTSLATLRSDAPELVLTAYDQMTAATASVAA
jgi:hypothetical protein